MERLVVTKHGKIKQVSTDTPTKHLETILINMDLIGLVEIMPA